MVKLLVGIYLQNHNSPCAHLICWVFSSSFAIVPIFDSILPGMVLLHHRHAGKHCSIFARSIGVFFFSNNAKFIRFQLKRDFVIKYLMHDVHQISSVNSNVNRLPMIFAEKKNKTNFSSATKINWITRALFLLTLSYKCKFIDL